MCKHKKDIIINGLYFKEKKDLFMYYNYYKYNLKSIFDLYDRPSQYKVNAYDKLCDYAISIGAVDYGCCSGNSCAFTFMIINKNNIMYFTKDNNYILGVVNE